MQNINLNVQRYPRGGIFWCEFGAGQGCEQSGVRPAIIIAHWAHSPVATVVPLTTKPKKDLPSHVQLPCKDPEKENNTVICEQIRTVSTTRLKNFMGCLNDEAMEVIDKALLIALKITKFQQQPQEKSNEIYVNEDVKIPRTNRYTEEYKQHFIERYKTLGTTGRVAEEYGISTDCAKKRLKNWNA